MQMSSDKINHSSLKVTPPDITVHGLHHIAVVGGTMNFSDITHLITTENSLSRSLQSGRTVLCLFFFDYFFLF